MPYRNLRYIAHNPKDATAYFNLGQVYQKNSRYEEAIEAYKNAIAIDNTNVNIKKELARTYHLCKNYNDALKLYDEILLTDKNDYNILFNKAIALHALNEYDAAIDIYQNLYSQRTEPKAPTAPDAGWLDR